MRALEVIELTGEPFGAGLPDEPVPWRPTVIVGLRAPRASSCERLDARVDADVGGRPRSTRCAALLPLGLERGVTASRAIGYAQAIAQLARPDRRGRGDRGDAAAHPRYARRQVSWFSRYPRRALARRRRRRPRREAPSSPGRARRP